MLLYYSATFGMVKQFSRQVHRIIWH